MFTPRTSNSTAGEKVRTRDFALLALAASPLFLNDFLFIHLAPALSIYAADYLSYTTALLLIAMIAPLRRAALAPAAVTAKWLPTLGWLAGLYCFERVAAALLNHPHIWPWQDERLFHYPVIENPTYFVVDVTAGLALAAVAEELIFRKIAGSFFQKLPFHPAALIAGAAILYAASHWGQGIWIMANMFVFGAAFMFVYLRVGRIWLLVLVHYAANLSGVYT